MGMFDIKTVGFQLSNDQMVKAMKKAAPHGFVTVGVHEKEGAVKPEGSDLTVAEYAAANHFGTNKIPARPFLDTGVRSVETKILRDIRECISKKLDIETTYKRVGVIAVGGVKQYITDLKTPPNALSTQRKKGAHVGKGVLVDNPLIDHGILRASITYEVHQ